MLNQKYKFKFKKFISDFFFSPPKFVIKNLPLNILGMQLIRILFYNTKIHLKKILINKNDNKDIDSKILHDLKENGYAIIENFFSKDEYLFIKETTQKIEQENVFKKENYGNADVVLGPLYLTKKFADEKNLINNIFQKKNINNIIGKIISEKIRYFPTPTYQKISLKESLIDKNDINSEFHPDRFFPCVKTFYYLNENKKENGAFSYYPGSHTITLDRIKYEYLHSVFNETNLSDNFYSFFNFEKVNGRITLKKEKLNEIYGQPIICEAPENSFVIANNMGFHKRGTMQPKNTRVHLRNSFYDFQMNRALQWIKNKYREKKYN